MNVKGSPSWYRIYTAIDNDIVDVIYRAGEPLSNMDVGFAISSLPTKETYWCDKYITLDIAIPTSYLDYLSYGIIENGSKTRLS